MALTGKLGTSDSKAGNLKLATIAATGPTTTIRWSGVSNRLNTFAKAAASGVLFAAPATERLTSTKATTTSGRWTAPTTVRSADAKGAATVTHWSSGPTLRDTTARGAVTSGRWVGAATTRDTLLKGGVVAVTFFPAVSTEYASRLNPLVFPTISVWRVTTTRSATASARLGVAPTARDATVHQGVQSAAWSGAASVRDTAAKGTIAQLSWRSGGTLRTTESKSGLGSARFGALTLVVLVAQKRGAAGLLLPALGTVRIVAVGQIGGARGSVFIGETVTATLGLGETALESASSGESPAPVLIIGEST